MPIKGTTICAEFQNPAIKVPERPTISGLLPDSVASGPSVEEGSVGDIARVAVRR